MRQLLLRRQELLRFIRGYGLGWGGEGGCCTSEHRVGENGRGCVGISLLEAHSLCCRRGYASQRISISGLLMLCYTMPYATVCSKFATPSPCKKEVANQIKKKKSKRPSVYLVGYHKVPRS